MLLSRKYHPFFFFFFSKIANFSMQKHPLFQYFKDIRISPILTPYVVLRTLMRTLKPIE